MALKTSDVLSFSINNVVANWEMVLLEIATSIVVTGAIALGNAAAVLRPFGGHAEFDRGTFFAILVTVVAEVALWVVVTAFPAAASARLYVDGDRAATAVPGRPRAAYRVFGFRRWLAAGRTWWVRVLGVQIVTTSIAVVAIGVPLLIIASSWETEVQAIGCVFAGVLFPFGVGAAVMALMWSRKAIVVAVDRGTGVGDVLRIAWIELNDRLGAHFVPALIVMLALSTGPGLESMKINGVDVGSFAGNAVSAAADCWVLAAFVALTEGR